MWPTAALTEWIDAGSIGDAGGRGSDRGLLLGDRRLGIPGADELLQRGSDLRTAQYAPAPRCRRVPGRPGFGPDGASRAAGSAARAPHRRARRIGPARARPRRGHPSRRPPDHRSAGAYADLRRTGHRARHRGEGAPSMKVFLAGGSGVIGRRLIPQLVAAGHQVAATTRSTAKGSMIQSLGAIPVVVDALDAPALSKALIDFRPEAVMNQLTDLPQRYNPRKLGPYYERTSRLRVEATRTLLAAAKEAGARRFVYQSLAFMYVPAGPAARD